VIQPEIPKGFLKDLRLVRTDIFPIWNKTTERFEIWHKDRRTALNRVVMVVENDDGSYRPLDYRTILFLSNNVAWSLMDRYPRPKEMADWYFGKKHDEYQKQVRKRKDYLKRKIKDEEKLWAEAIDLARKGIFDLPDKKEKKVFIYYNSQDRGEQTNEEKSRPILQPDGLPYRGESLR